ncbi:hypothetical protein [Mesorhizobium sp. 43Arga]
MDASEMSAIGDTLMRIVTPDMSPKQLVKAAQKAHPQGLEEGHSPSGLLFDHRECRSGHRQGQEPAGIRHSGAYPAAGLSNRLALRGLPSPRRHPLTAVPRNEFNVKSAIDATLLGRG